ncbi:MAG: hypothetical protein K6L81_17755 [Agarilytica sp.]
MVKQRSTTAAADRFEEILSETPSLICGYEPGQIKEMCTLAANIVAGYEYWIVSDEAPIIRVPGQSEINAYYEGIYKDQTVLVLKYEDKHYSYTRNNICKQLRGHLYHSDQNDRGMKKDEAFRRYVFEGDAPSYVEFSLSYCWLISGGMSFNTGNVDSHNPFLERIQINDKEKVEFTTIESMTLCFAREFQSLTQEGGLNRNGRCSQIATEEELVTRFGDRIGKKCYETIMWHQESFPEA